MIRALFVGLGSIGQRHFRNLAEILVAKAEAFQIDAVRGTSHQLPEDIENTLGRQYSSGEDVSEEYDLLFITNPTMLHYETLRQLGNKANRIFIEKPVFHKSALDLTPLALENQKIYYVASPLRYTRIIQFLRKYLAGRKVYGVRAMCSSYLPEWRPGQDYRKTYSAHRAEGGGVGIDLIHEWDYLTYLFGFPKQTTSYRAHVSDLEIDSDDIAVYIGQYDDKLVSVNLDYFGRKARRELEIYFDDDVLVADFITGQIRWLQSGKIMNLSEPRDAYQKEELNYFLHLDVKDAAGSGIQHALKVLRIAEGEKPV
ncbi:MAG: Gfo/Idh/MocA family oxidoreductase [Schwartzia succinivorans]|nr:Gfo/Idh/MocA family oxidoreductase [Schwartzia succinivorans]